MSFIYKASPRSAESRKIIHWPRQAAKGEKKFLGKYVFHKFGERFGWFEE
jgi:hypothetical protein